MEVTWFFRTKAVLMFLQDGFKTFDTNDIGGCPAGIIVAPLDLFYDCLRLALGFRRDVV